ncbi:MAG TPA: hypothetical protein VKE22_05395 [Haliangiales bacterium]|nr:hypothetical protein [Haliangiales bacterium]
MRTRAFIAVVLAAVCGLLVAVRAQLRETRRPAAAAVEVAASPPDWAPRVSLPGEDRVEGWPYEALSPEERAVVDRGHDVTGWDGVHQAFSAAPRE